MRAGSTYRSLLCCAALLLTAGVRADPALVYATLQPQQIHLGEAALLTITNLGNGPTDYALPQVPGLQFEILDQRHQTELTNGVGLSSTVILIRVTAQRAGAFNIPPAAKQDKLLVLEVLPNHGPPAAYSNSFNPAAPPPPKTPPVASAAKLAGIKMQADGAAYVRLELPKRSVYVGESVPVDIEVGARAGFVTSLNGLPKLNGAEFTLDNLSRQPDRRELLIDGKPFVTLTWHSLIAAVKPGSFTLSVDTPLTIRFTTQSRQDSALDNMLGDPFLHRLFGAMVSREVNVTSPDSDLTVLPLPAGAPPDFSGAVGSFTLRTDLSAAQAALGEPLTLRMHIKGSGNFDRVDSTMLGSSPAWKSYPPTSTFKAEDKVGHQGEKSFEQPVVALQPGAQSLPGVHFTYFDPEARKYQTAQSPALDVTIAATASQPAPVIAPGKPVSVAALRADHRGADRGSRSLVPLYLQPVFLAVPPLLSMAFAAGWLARRRRTGGDEATGQPRPRRETSASRSLRLKLATARRAGDAAGFLGLAQRAVQDGLARQWRTPAASVMRTEIEQRLGPDDEAAALFRLAEELRYAPRGEARFDYARWEKVALDVTERTS